MKARESLKADREDGMPPAYLSKTTQIPYRFA
jgi:hypothetical protein